MSVEISRTDADFIALLGKDLPRVQRLARTLVGDASAAEGLIAEAIARTLPKWREGSVDDCGAYLGRVVVNLAARRWRRRALGLRRDHAALDWLETTANADDEFAERDRTVRAVMKLPIRRRAVVVLRFYEDLPLNRIADLLGISEGTVKSQLSRALEQLRADLGGLKEL